MYHIYANGERAQSSQLNEDITLIHISRDCLPYAYDEKNSKEFVTMLNSHLMLILACLEGSFIIDTYYIEKNGEYLERGYDQKKYIVELTGQGKIICQTRRYTGPNSKEFSKATARSVFIPIRSYNTEPFKIPDRALARIDNVENLASAFAKLHGFKSADEIIAYSRSKKKQLH